MADGYNAGNLAGFVDRSLANLATEHIDLLHLHGPPPTCTTGPQVFAALDDLVAAGKLRAYGVSVERVEEAEKAILYQGVASVQIIFNIFRTRPAERFLAEAAAKGVGVIARVPLASGLLSGRMTAATTFEPDDHRIVQPSRGIVRRGGDLLRRAPTRKGSPWSTRSARSSPRAGPWPSWRCDGS